MYKNIAEIDFGTTDARHAMTHGTFDENLFNKIFIEPFGINKSEYQAGRKSFIYGIKGSGKSAFLKSLEIEQRKKCITKFAYFSDSLSDIKENSNEIIGIGADELSNNADSKSYWVAFFLLMVAKLIHESGLGNHKKFLEFVRRQSTQSPKSYLDKIFGSAPTMESWAAQLGPNSSMKLDGKFDRIINIEQFYEGGLDLLSKPKLPKPIWIFIDELEITYEDDHQFNRDVKVASALVRTIRDLNEQFRERGIDIFICCGIRKEISERILGGDAAKIVTDLGEEVSWRRPTWSYEDKDFIHPLFEICLRRIYFSNNPGRSFMSDHDRGLILTQYFPFFRDREDSTRYWQSKILDLTTYRPRDVSIIFNAAKKIDGKRNSFKKETFKRLIFKPLNEALWTDFSEALRSQFSASQVGAFRKVFNRLPVRFYFQDFLSTLDDFSADPTMVEVLDKFEDADWARVLREFYILGAIGNAEQGQTVDERLQFHFRGYTDGLVIQRNVEIIKQNAMRDA